MVVMAGRLALDLRGGGIGEGGACGTLAAAADGANGDGSVASGAIEGACCVSLAAPFAAQWLCCSFPHGECAFSHGDHPSST